MTFVGRIGPDGQVTDFAVTEEGRQAMVRADVGEMDEIFVATFRAMLVDCMYYAPGPEAGAGDTWELSRETLPGLSNYMLMMFGSEQISITDEATCTLESPGGDGTPAVVTFVGSRRIEGPAGGAPFDPTQLGMAITGRVEFNPGAEVPLIVVRQTTMTLPAGMAGGQAGMETVTTERITLTPPGVDAPAAADGESELLPTHPGIEDEPTTQPTTRPVAQEPATQPANAAEPVAAE